MSLAGAEWEILGRMTEASEEADDDEVPGEVCSVRMVFPCAMHALFPAVRTRGSDGESRDTYYSSWFDCPELDAILAGLEAVSLPEASVV